MVEAEKLLEAEKEKAPEEVQKVLEEHEEEIEKAKVRLKKFFKKDGGK
jgi:F0F1-type ATP synthase membrane subunit b/b'